eukprot:4501373-Alexandrium_andersonii.AAC.1
MISSTWYPAKRQKLHSDVEKRKADSDVEIEKNDQQQPIGGKKRKKLHSGSTENPCGGSTASDDPYATASDDPYGSSAM